jgi:de-etiolated-1
MDFPKYRIQPVIYPDGEDLTKGLRANEIPVQNIVARLNNRQLWGYNRRVGTEKYLQRSMYQSLFPNFTVTHVDKPPCFLRKFTPDGKYFVAFSLDQMSVEVYHFEGPQVANSLFVDLGKRWARNSPDGGTNNPPPAKVCMFYGFEYSMKDGFIC